MTSIGALILGVASLLGGLSSSGGSPSLIGVAILVTVLLVLLSMIFMASAGGYDETRRSPSEASGGGNAGGSRPWTAWLRRYFTTIAVCFILVAFALVVTGVKVAHEDQANYLFPITFTSGINQHVSVTMSGFGEIVFNWTELTAPGASPPQVQVKVVNSTWSVLFSGFTNYGAPGNAGLVVAPGTYQFNVTVSTSSDTEIFLAVHTAAFSSIPILQL